MSSSKEKGPIAVETSTLVLRWDWMTYASPPHKCTGLSTSPGHHGPKTEAWGHESTAHVYIDMSKERTGTEQADR